MEWILIYNGISPYLYLLAVYLFMDTLGEDVYTVCGIAFLVQLIATIVLSIISKDKAKLAKVTMIVKFVQIPYYIFFFVIAVLGVLVMMGLMGIGLLFIPVFIAIDIGVFLTTVIPEEVCAIRLIRKGNIPVWKFILYLFGNCIYVADIVFSVMIHRDYKKMAESEV